jgi:hypothetical protein
MPSDFGPAVLLGIEKRWQDVHMEIALRVERGTYGTDRYSAHGTE